MADITFRETPMGVLLVGGWPDETDVSVALIAAADSYKFWYDPMARELWMLLLNAKARYALTGWDHWSDVWRFELVKGVTGIPCSWTVESGIVCIGGDRYQLHRACGSCTTWQSNVNAYADASCEWCSPYRGMSAAEHLRAVNDRMAVTA